jgi:hypothetical protein
MSCLILQIGQCGNQIGNKLFSKFIKQINNSSECHAQVIYDTFFTSVKDNIPTANAILIDMESKVIERCIRSNN